MTCLYTVCICYNVFLFFCLILFFFVKQKTAYEMRISDWSSDVCSSDLTQYFPAADRNRTDRHALFYSVRRDLPEGYCCSGAFRSSADKIGRASCRERVCQYV